jgi:hypothetical protein
MHLNMHDQALMLAGMAVEVQLKAILVNDPSVRAVVTVTRPPGASAASILWTAFYSHNISDLARACNIKLSVKRRKIANALSQYIYWRGRYVVPKERGVDDLLPAKLETGLVGQRHQITIEDARELIDYVVSEVKVRLYGQA